MPAEASTDNGSAVTSKRKKKFRCEVLEHGWSFDFPFKAAESSLYGDARGPGPFLWRVLRLGPLFGQSKLPNRPFHRNLPEFVTNFTTGGNTPRQRYSQTVSDKCLIAHTYAYLDALEDLPTGEQCAYEPKHADIADKRLFWETWRDLALQKIQPVTAARAASTTIADLSQPARAVGSPSPSHTSSAPARSWRRELLGPQFGGVLPDRPADYWQLPPFVTNFTSDGQSKHPRDWFPQNVVDHALAAHTYALLDSITDAPLERAYVELFWSIWHDLAVKRIPPITQDDRRGLPVEQDDRRGLPVEQEAPTLPTALFRPSVFAAADDLEF